MEKGRRGKINWDNRKWGWDFKGNSKEWSEEGYSKRKEIGEW